MLRFGDKAPGVRDVVEKLRKLGFGLDVTDRFNTTARKSVETLQASTVDASGQPLKVDGKVGPNTEWANDAAFGKQKLEVATFLELPPTPDGGSGAGRRALSIAIREATDKNAGK